MNLWTIRKISRWLYADDAILFAKYTINKMHVNGMKVKQVNYLYYLRSMVTRIGKPEIDVKKEMNARNKVNRV